MESRRLLILLVIVAMFFICPIVACGPNFYMETQTKDVVTGTIQDKYIKRFSSEGADSFMMEVKKDSGETEIFSNGDSMFNGKWNSADVQASVKNGDRVRIYVYGWRIPIISMFRNIYKLEKLPPR